MNLITTPDSSRPRIAAVGMYDGVHTGHRYLLDILKLEGRYRSLTPAAVTFSHHPLTVVSPADAPALLSALPDRVSLIGAEGIDDVILLSFTEDLRNLSAEEFIRLLHDKFGVRALVVGFDNRLGHDRVSSVEKLREIGSKTGVEVIGASEHRPSYTKSGVNSSAIRRALHEGHPEEAARMLGRPYAIEGKVVRGNHIGSGLGFPTANIAPADNKLLIPLKGAYAAFVTTPDGVRRPAMVNIGYRPTVAATFPGAEHSPGTLSIEAHIIDFSGYLYDDQVKVELISYLRPEQRFESPQRLRAQLETDLRNTRRILSDAGLKRQASGDRCGKTDTV